MKIPLQYQRTEYDCGPTSLLNGISYLFHRDDIPPDLVQHIMTYCLDSYNGKGERGKQGTSYIAMQFLAGWLNHFGLARKFPIEAKYLVGPLVSTARDGMLASALQQGGVAMVRVMYGCWHYVLITGYEENSVNLWDPYYRVRPFVHKDSSIEILNGFPCEKNRKVPLTILNSQDKGFYSMGPIEAREAVLLFNRTTRRTAEKTIEYYI